MAGHSSYVATSHQARMALHLCAVWTPAGLACYDEDALLAPEVHASAAPEVMEGVGGAAACWAAHVPTSYESMEGQGPLSVRFGAHGRTSIGLCLLRAQTMCAAKALGILYCGLITPQRGDHDPASPRACQLMSGAGGWCAPCARAGTWRTWDLT